MRYAYIPKFSIPINVAVDSSFMSFQIIENQIIN